ncbi:MAG: YARHG domain-containing protein [Bacteroidales bacterium]|nr:YARHG domain-containing protein [Bacteroidales bacterium]
MGRAFLLTLIVCATTMWADAQTVVGTSWSDGFTVYRTTEGNDQIKFIGGRSDLGDYFFLRKTDQNMFVITETNSFGQKDAEVEYRTIADGDGKKHNVLVALDSQKQMIDIVEEGLGDVREENFLALLEGDYTDNDNRDWHLRGTTVYGDEIWMTFDVDSIEIDVVLDDIDIPNTFKVKNYRNIVLVDFTKSGLDFFNAEEDPDDGWCRYRKKSNWRGIVHDSDLSRFAFTSKKLVNRAMLEYFDNSMLRVMRNEIYARHGYNFASADLKTYFSQKKWYKPVKNNSDVKLSDVEQFNVDIIKMMEK